MSLTETSSRIGVWVGTLEASMRNIKSSLSIGIRVGPNPVLTNSIRRG